MDIFFFIYYISYGLPLGVVELPHGVVAREILNWYCPRANTNPLRFLLL